VAILGILLPSKYRTKISNPITTPKKKKKKEKKKEIHPIQVHGADALNSSLRVDALSPLSASSVLLVYPVA
jgi:hypothetical protein